MAGDWYALGRIQSFGNDATGQVVSFAAAATISGDEEMDYLYVADYVIEDGRVTFAPGAIEKAIAEYGRAKDQDRVNAVCERALTADPDAVAATYAEMLEQERREWEGFFACANCTPGTAKRSTRPSSDRGHDWVPHGQLLGESARTPLGSPPPTH